MVNVRNGGAARVVLRPARVMSLRLLAALSHLGLHPRMGRSTGHHGRYGVALEHQRKRQ